MWFTHIPNTFHSIVLWKEVSFLFGCKDQTTPQVPPVKEIYFQATHDTNRDGNLMRADL